MQSNATLFSTAISKTQVVKSCCIAIALSGIALSSFAPAQAKLLNGHIESFDIESTPHDTARGMAPSGDNGAQGLGGASRPEENEVAGPPPSTSVPIVHPVVAPPSVAYGRAPNVGPTSPPPNSFPISFAGRWQCVTKVIDSAVQTVGVGTELVSEVFFVELNDSRVVARWIQPGWTETQASALSWSSREAQTDRTSYYFGEGTNGAWASRSRDHFLQNGPDRLECKSYIDQYMNGRYIGRYRTVSILTRLGAVNTIARGPKVEK
ncbi:MAG: hypothetical protein K2X93_14130 [Candidatus Obscuribacterales bacterium]|nr:hypothetical protein [Candidatus Obscuribacterales bacterium]